MKKEDKSKVIEVLTAELKKFPAFYLTDISGFGAAVSSNLRRACFKQGVKLIVVKNTMLRKAMENSGLELSETYGVLKGNTSLMLTDTGNVPAKLIEEFRKKQKIEKPIIKAAYVEECVYLGDQIDVLKSIKSKNELIGDIVTLLQSPTKNVISALQSGGNTLAGVVKTLQERTEN